MKYWALGLRGAEVRTVIAWPDKAGPQLNKQFGEAIIEVSGPGVTGKISNDGTTVIPLGFNLDNELALIRQQRAALLARCDWTVLPDSPLTQDQRDAWAAYRTKLRNITIDQPNVAFADIVWPTEPSS